VFAAEACLSFARTYGAILTLRRTFLHGDLSQFYATVAERVAFEKIQDCFREEGQKTIILNPQIMVMSSLIPLDHVANGGRLCTNDQCDH
jgi:hypothetical protein